MEAPQWTAESASGRRRALQRQLATILVSSSEDQDLYQARWYNPTFGSRPISIVASVSVHGEDVIDWAAYIGSSHENALPSETAKEAARWGRKLNEVDARYYFPEIVESYRS